MPAVKHSLVDFDFIESKDQALEILMEGRGTHFDPQLLDRFADLAPELYTRFTGDASDHVHSEISTFVRKYFPRDAGSFTYL